MSFSPKSPPLHLDPELIEYLDDLEQRISEAFQTGEFEKINLQALAKAPDYPQEGDLIYADGTNYDPGEGTGFYRYDTDYTKLG